VIRAIILLLLMMFPYESVQPMNGVATSSPSREIVYVSANLRYVTIFAADGARFGPPLDYRPGYPAAATRYIRRADGVQCVTIGPVGNSIEYAIKRPIVVGERYRCERTSFRVVRCFDSCAAAVIEYDSHSERKLGAPEGYIYVDSCAGVLAFSQSANVKKGIPLDSPLLRGEVGILADAAYPSCSLY
jgi:hypothetical protein